MKSRPNEKAVAWSKEYKAVLGLNKQSFHEIFYDNYNDNLNEIIEIIRDLNLEV